MDQEIDVIRKTRRDKRETACSVKRHKNGCGICGSLNVVQQGVVYCTECGEEIDFISDQHHYFYYWQRNEKDLEEPNCKCLRIFPFGKKRAVKTYRPLKRITVEKCADCGAVKGYFCPNCNKSSSRANCWKHWDGRIYCQNCSYKNC